MSLTSTSIRSTYEFLEFAKKHSGAGKRFKDISACFRFYLDLGQRTENLIEIRKNPEKQQEFEQKLLHLTKIEEIPNILQTMNEEEIDSIIFLAMNEKKQKVQNVIDLVNKN